MYWVASTVQTTLVCPLSTTLYILNVTGILTILDDCILYTWVAILFPSTEVNKSFFHKVLSRTKPFESRLNLTRVNK